MVDTQHIEIVPFGFKEDDTPWNFTLPLREAWALRHVLMEWQMEKANGKHPVTETAVERMLHAIYTYAGNTLMQQHPEDFE